MRSYHYHEGIWDVISDPMSAIESSSEDSEFHKGLRQLGFKALFVDRYFSQVGSIRIYARDHAKLPGQRSKSEFPYAFVCIIKLGETFIRIWIIDLPSTLLFMREIDARDTTPTEEFFSSAYGLLSSLETAADQISTGTIEVTIRQPKTK